MSAELVPELVQLVRDQQERIVELERELAVERHLRTTQAAPAAANSDGEASVVDAEYLTVKEAAALLSVCKDTIYAAVRDGLIPGAIRIKGSIRLRRTELLNWSRSGEAAPPAQRQQRRSRKQRRP